MSAVVGTEPSQQQQALAALKAAGPPYLPRIATLGGHPHGGIDIGVSAMFIGIFAILAAIHMTIFNRNKKREHLFVFSAVTFGFCMSRIVTFVMRIATAKNPRNASVAIAAGIFVSAGVILLYIINMCYAQRILRGYHPKFGNSKPVSVGFLVYYVSVVLVLIMNIVVAVLTFYTLDQDRLTTCRNVQRFGIVYFTVFSFLPTPLVLLARFISSPYSKERFGKLGTLNHKVIIVVIASLILTLENSVRAATSFLPIRPLNNPAWYHNRTAFYVFLPTLEVLVVILYAASRVDQRFFVDGKAEKLREENEKSDEP